MSASSSSSFLVFLLLRCPLPSTQCSPQSGVPWLMPSSRGPPVTCAPALALLPSVTQAAATVSLPWTLPQARAHTPQGEYRWDHAGPHCQPTQRLHLQRGVSALPGRGHSSYGQQSWSGNPNQPGRRKQQRGNSLGCDEPQSSHEV